MKAVCVLLIVSKTHEFLFLIVVIALSRVISQLNQIVQSEFDIVCADLVH